MAKTIKLIKQDLELLETEVATITEELRNLNLQYLESLGQLVQKQLMMATYQICTHIYPEMFLQLSFNNRQKVQQNLRQLSKQNQTQLLAAIDTPFQISSPKTTNLIEKILEQLPKIADQQTDNLNQEEETFEQDSDTNSENAEPEQKIELKSLEISEEMKLKLTKLKNNPSVILQWQKQVEKIIHRNLDKLSHQANEILQQAEILPSQVPDKFIEVAIEAQENGAAISGPPNLLNMLVESESEDDDNIVQITAIHLRLSEIEFADPNLSILRQQIRQILAKLETLEQKYKKKQKELAIAEAEAAWRSSWYED